MAWYWRIMFTLALGGILWVFDTTLIQRNSVRWHAIFSLAVSWTRHQINNIGAESGHISSLMRLVRAWHETNVFLCNCSMVSGLRQWGFVRHPARGNAGIYPSDIITKCLIWHVWPGIVPWEWILESVLYINPSNAGQQTFSIGLTLGQCWPANI